MSEPQTMPAKTIDPVLEKLDTVLCGGYETMDLPKLVFADNEMGAGSWTHNGLAPLIFPAASDLWHYIWSTGPLDNPYWKVESLIKDFAPAELIDSEKATDAEMLMGLPKKSPDTPDFPFALVQDTENESYFGLKVISTRPPDMDEDQWTRLQLMSFSVMLDTMVTLTKTCQPIMAPAPDHGMEADEALAVAPRIDIKPAWVSLFSKIKSKEVTVYMSMAAPKPQ